MAPLEVVGAVFQRNNKFLACRRKNGLSNAGQWEFPGGKRNARETFAAALIREIFEELQVSIDVGYSLGNTIHNTGALIIDLHCFIVPSWQGDFLPTDHDELRWCSVDDLKALRLSDADVPFIDRISTYLQSV